MDRQFSVKEMMNQRFLRPDQNSGKLLINSSLSLNHSAEDPNFYAVIIFALQISGLVLSFSLLIRIQIFLSERIMEIGIRD